MKKAKNTKLALKLSFLKNRRIRFLNKQNSMDDTCSLKEWFQVSNIIRKINTQIMEIQNVR
jgi:hypothetical protein